MTQNDVKNFKLHLEIIRIIAIFFVIFNHTGQEGYFLFYNYEPDTFSYWIYMFLSVFCKFSVPIFFAVSGALLLKKEEDIKIIFSHRVFRMISITVLFSFLYYILCLFLNNENFNLLDFLKKFILYNGYYWNSTLWFLYVFTIYLILLPFLREIVKNLTKKLYYYAVVIHLIFMSFFPIIYYSLSNEVSDFSLLEKIAFLSIFPIIGFYLEYKLPMQILNFKRILYLWTLNIITIFITCCLTHFKSQSIGVHIEDFHNSFVIINCIVIYITIKYICCRINFSKLVSNILISVGRCTLGIYLLHISIMVLVSNMRYFELFHRHLNHILTILIYCFLVFLIGLLMTLILKKIPIVKHLI
ncbi:MAG: acyltransferase [Selenomonadaceae bacterium]|nr:acyltransferase [Selenomonadaceae bacterium]